MAEWLVELGIGEDRAICFENGHVIAARLQWPGRLTAGQVEDARLVSRKAGSTRGTLRFASGEEALIDGLPREAAEGATIRAIVTRSAIAESGRLKLAQARPTNDDLCPAPTLADRLESQGCRVQPVRRFPDGEWESVFADAWDGRVDFESGSLTLSPTPAMTVIDIDGMLKPASLALAAVPSIASAILRLDLGGSIGIDFPSLAERADRKAVDDALQHVLDDWPHQHTSMNGFGFVQLVAKLERPSILHLLHYDRAGAAARRILRQAEGLVSPGQLLLTAHPTVRKSVEPDWETDLARRTGREIAWKVDPSIALESGFAQVVTS